MRIRWNRLRPKYEHGCGGTCGRKAGYCPGRKQIRADTGPTKSRAGRRTIGLPDPLIKLLRTHREHQEAERLAVRQLWHDEGWVFAKLDGRPLNPNTDYHKWKALLEEAGLRDGRLHDARHTAGTVQFLLLQVPTPMAMSIHHGMFKPPYGQAISTRARRHPQRCGQPGRWAALGGHRDRPRR